MNDFVFRPISNCEFDLVAFNLLCVLFGIIDFKDSSLFLVFGASGSGNPHEVDRCESCGTAIISYYEGQREWGVVKVGTLQNPDQFPPGVHLHIKQKVSWIEIPEGVPAFEEGYDFETLWPSEGYTRFMNFC